MPDRIAARLWERPRALLTGPSWRRAAGLRRAAAAALAGLALVLALLPSGTSPGVPLVVAAADLAPGATVRGEDLRLREWPADLVPAGALRDPAAAGGRVLVGAARAGEPLTDVRLTGPGPLAALGSGQDAAAVPIRLADADVAALLPAGSRVDVVTIAAAGDRPVVLAADASVLAVLPGAAGGRGRLVLVGLPREAATRVAAASLSEQVAVTLR